MSQSTISTKRGCPIGCVIVALLLMVLIVGAVGVFLFLNLNASTPTMIWANISSPANGYVAEVNAPLPVQATAQHSGGIMRVEVYADGALALAQNSTAPDGADPFLLLQPWTPLTPGRHILMARAYNREGKFGDSSVVYVDVVKLRDPTVKLPVDSFPREGAALPSLNQIATRTGITVPRLIESNPDLGGRDPNAPLPSDASLDVPRSPAAPPSPGTSPGSDGTDGSTGAPPPLPDAATAPTNLVASAECASVQLTWSDSPDEEQYVVYRLGPGESAFSRLATTLPMNTTTFRDPISAWGEYQYRVAAVRRGLEGFSQVTVRTPDSCAPDIGTPPRIPDLVLTFMTIDTVTRYPGIYCYVTIDGRAEHVPSSDFSRMLHDADGLRYDLRLLDNHGIYVLPHLDSEPLTLSGECYGDASTPGGDGVAREDWLGSFSATHPSTDWDGRVREFGITSDRAFHLRYRIGRRTSAASMRVGDLGDAEVVTPPRLEDPLMPVPTRVNLESPIGTFCLIPGLCPRRVAWSWADNDFFTEDTITGYRMRLNLIDLTLPRHPTRELGRWDIIGGRNKSAPRPALPSEITCGARYSINVLAYQVDARDGIARESSWSGPLQWDLPACTRDADVHVTVETLTFGPPRGAGEIRDDEYCDLVTCTDRRLEVSGWVRVQGLVIAGGSTVPDRPVPPSGPCPAGLFCTTGGTYGATSAMHSPWDIDLTYLVRPDSSIWVNVALYENNFLAAPNRLCIGNIEFPRRSAIEWQRTNETRELTSDFGEASCRMVIRVQGRPSR